MRTVNFTIDGVKINANVNGISDIECINEIINKFSKLGRLQIINVEAGDGYTIVRESFLDEITEKVDSIYKRVEKMIREGEGGQDDWVENIIKQL